MSVQLNVPGSPGPQKQGPVDVFELVPVSDITTQQGGTNLYVVNFGGMQTIQVDGTNCDADLFLQFFLQDSPVGQPFLYFLWANQRHVLRFDSPIQYIVISNATAGLVLPPFLSNFLPYRNAQNTTGFILLSAQDSSVAVDGISNPVHIGGTLNIAGTVTADQGGGWAVGQSGSWNVGPAANFPVVNPANSQLVVSRPYIEQGTLAYTAPQTAHNLGPLTIPANVTGISLGNATPDTVTLVVTGVTSGLTYYSAQLSPHTIGIVALPLGGFENFNLLVTDSGSGSRSIYYAFIYDTSTIVPQDWGNGALSIAPASGSSLTAQPGTGPAGSISSVTNGTFGGSAAIGAVFARPSLLWSVSASLYVVGTGGVAGIPMYGQTTIYLQGQTSAKKVHLLALSWAQGPVDGTTEANNLAHGSGALAFPYPVDLATILPTDASVRWGADYNSNNNVVPFYTVDALTG